MTLAQPGALFSLLSLVHLLFLLGAQVFRKDFQSRICFFLRPSDFQLWDSETKIPGPIFFFHMMFLLLVGGWCPSTLSLKNHGSEKMVVFERELLFGGTRYTHFSLPLCRGRKGINLRSTSTQWTRRFAAVSHVAFRFRQRWVHPPRPRWAMPQLPSRASHWTRKVPSEETHGAKGGVDGWLDTSPETTLQGINISHLGKEENHLQICHYGGIC